MTGLRPINTVRSPPTWWGLQHRCGYLAFIFSLCSLLWASWRTRNERSLNFTCRRGVLGARAPLPTVIALWRMQPCEADDAKPVFIVRPIRKWKKEANYLRCIGDFKWSSISSFYLLIRGMIAEWIRSNYNVRDWQKNHNFYRTGKCGINEYTRQVIVAPSFSHPWRETSLDSLTPRRSAPRGRNKWKAYACAQWNTPLPHARRLRSSRETKPMSVFFHYEFLRQN